MSNRAAEGIQVLIDIQLCEVKQFFYHINRTREMVKKIRSWLE